MSDLEFALNLEWYEDHDVVFNEYNPANNEGFNKEKVLRSSYKDYSLLVYPVRDNGKLIGYAFSYENNEGTDYDDSFINDIYFETEDIARSKAEYELRGNIEW